MKFAAMYCKETEQPLCYSHPQALLQNDRNADKDSRYYPAPVTVEQHTSLLKTWNIKTTGWNTASFLLSPTSWCQRRSPTFVRWADAITAGKSRRRRIFPCQCFSSGRRAPVAEMAAKSLLMNGPSHTFMRNPAIKYSRICLIRQFA